MKPRLIFWMSLGLTMAFFVLVFPSLAMWLADAVPFAHLFLAPFGEPLISAVVFAALTCWLLYVRLSPESPAMRVRVAARKIGLCVAATWVAYAAFWMFIYWRGGV